MAGIPSEPKLAGLYSSSAAAFSAAGPWLIRLVLFFLLAVLFAQALIAFRRVGTSRKSVLSLLLVAAGTAVALLLETLQAWMGMGRIPSFLLLGLGFVVLTLLIAGLVIGMLGLLELQDRRRKLTAGRTWALAAIACSSILLTLVLAAGPANILIVPGLLKPFVPGEFSGEQLVVDEFNFQFAPPGKPWKTKSPGFGRSALQFQRDDTQMVLKVSAEKFGPGFDSDQLAEAARARQRSRFKQERLLSIRPQSLNGLSGVRVETRAETKESELFLVQWYCFLNGFGYQLHAEGPWAMRQHLLAETERFFAGFRCLEPNRTTDEHAPPFPSDFFSSRYGYKVELENSRWRQWLGLQRDFSWFEFAARQEKGAYLVVVPAWFGEAMDDAAIQAALLRVMNINYPDPALRNRQQLDAPGVRGVQFDYERYVLGTRFQYRLRIQDSAGFAWLTAIWMAASAPDFDEIAADAFRRVKPLEGPVPPLDAAGLTAQENTARGLMLNEAGGHYFRKKDYGRAQNLFAEAYACSPASVFLENALSAWAELNQPAEALAFVEKELRNRPGNRLLKAYQARFQAENGDLEAAVNTYSGLLQADVENLKLLNEHLLLLTRLGRHKEALAVIERQLQASDSWRLRLLQASIHQHQKNYPEAIRLLREAHDNAPFVADVGHALAAVLIQGGEFQEALSICSDWVARSDPNPTTLRLKGRAEAELGRFAEAKASLEEALRLLPGDTELVRSLQAVSAALGQGNNSAVQKMIPPVSIPKQLLQDPPVATPPNFGAEYGAFYSVRITALQFDSDNSYRETDYGRVEILDSAGVAAFTTVQVAFDPLTQDIFVNSVLVRDSSGVTVASKVDTAYVTDDTTSELQTHKKILNVPIAGLRPGVVLEFMVTRRSAPAMDASPFLQYTFARAFPVRRSLVYLAGSTPGLKSITSPTIQPQKLQEGTYWEQENLVVIRPEPLQAPPAQFLPTLWFGRDSPQWSTLANRYLTSISDRLSLTQELREMTARLVQNLGDNDVRIMALARYVQTNFTYKALEFGRRGHIPQALADFHRNGFGDCKDHSVMLQQMLVAAGIPAKLALVNSRADLVKELPSLEQFDHMLVYIPGRASDAFIDCTHKGALPGKGPPPGLDGREALILHHLNPRFERVPATTEPSSFVTTKWVSVTNGQDAFIRQSLSVSGLDAAQIRAQLLELPVSSQRLFLQGFLGTANAELREWQLLGLHEPGAPLNAHFSYTLRQVFHRIQDRLVGSIPALTERFYLSYETMDKRISPFLIRSPRSFESKLIVYPPEEFVLEPQIPDQETLPSEFLEATLAAVENSSGLELVLKIRQNEGYFPADQYSSFVQQSSRAFGLIEKQLTFRKDSP